MREGKGGKGKGKHDDYLLVAGEGDLLLVEDGCLEVERRHGGADCRRRRDHGGDIAAGAAVPRGEEARGLGDREGDGGGRRLGFGRGG